MALRILNSSEPDAVADEMKGAIEAEIAGAAAEVEARGAGHYRVRVVSAAFAGKTPVQRQRMVYAAIGRFLHGDAAPVHAIDQMETITPA
jgi:acid stress-induced BolA-like protein IbaG/YrbA